MDNLILKSYVYANGEALCQHNGNHLADKYFYLHDRTGSVRQIIDANGVVVNHYTYKPFGEMMATECTENTENPFKFTGQWFDPEIGQYYLRARQYDPSLFRFTSYDPVSGQFEEPITLHKYLYCKNDPVNRIDPLGLDAYLLYAPEGGPDWIEEILGEDAGHIAVVVDTPNGKVMLGSAAYGDVLRPMVKNNLQEMLKAFTSVYGETEIMRFKNKTLGWSSGETSDKRIYDYIKGGLGKNMEWPYCSRFGQQALAYGGYQLGILNGLCPSWL